MNILHFGRGIINLCTVYLTVLLASWTVFFFGVLIFEDGYKDSLRDLLMAEGFDFGILVYSFTAIFLTVIIYIYDRIYPHLLKRKGFLFAIAFIIQSLFYLGIENIVDYKLDRIIPNFGNQYVNLFIIYFIFTGFIVLLLWLFEKIKVRISKK